MELLISLPAETNPQSAINLKNFIDGASIEGVKQTEVNRGDYQVGQMGVGNVLSQVKTIIESATMPLVELVKCLQMWVKNYRTEITIEANGGEKIVLSHGRSIKPEELEKMIVAFQKNLK